MSGYEPDMAADAEQRDLRQALLRLQAFGASPGAAMHLNRAEDSLRFVQRRIAATVLPRRLVFQWDDIPRLAADAKGCRLLRFALLDEKGAEARVTEFSDPSDPDAATAAMARLILDLGGNAARIGVRGYPLPAAAESLAGVPASFLTCPFGLRPTLAWPEVFLEAAGDALFAAAELREDMLYPLFGDDAEVEALALRVERDLPVLETLLTEPCGEPALLMLSGPVRSCLYAAIDDSLFLAQIASGEEATVTRVWQTHVTPRNMEARPQRAASAPADLTTDDGLMRRPGGVRPI